MTGHGKRTILARQDGNTTVKVVWLIAVLLLVIVVSVR